MRRFLPVFVAAACLASSALAQIPATIYEIQYTEDPSGDSPLAVQVVSSGGVVTGVLYSGFVMQ